MMKITAGQAGSQIEAHSCELGREAAQSWAVQTELDGAADVEFAHAGLQRGALHAEDGGGAFGAGDAPFGLAEGAEDVLALGFFERGDGSVTALPAGDDGGEKEPSAEMSEMSLTESVACFSSASGTRSSLPGLRSTARSIRFSNSRIFPGHE